MRAQSFTATNPQNTETQLKNDPTLPEPALIHTSAEYMNTFSPCKFTAQHSEISPHLSRNYS